MRKKVKDKYFKPYLSTEQIDDAVSSIARRITADLKDEKPIFLGILNGSFIFASDLIRKLDFPMHVSFVKVASYIGTRSTGAVTELIGLNESLIGQTVVVIEDIVDSGNTIEKIVKLLKDHGVKDVKIATLLLKPKAYKKNIKIDYVALEIPDDFVVGYGLDYDGWGRNIPGIYKIED
jgi:hypoxanthine phosphoribosyltransferase